MILSFYRQIISRGIISGIAFISIVSYTEYRHFIIFLWIIMTLWSDIFKILNFKNKNNNKNQEIIYKKELIFKRRPSWKRELKVDTLNNSGSFHYDINTPSLLIVKKTEPNFKASDNSEEKKKRKRAGKKVRERLARKKLRLIELSSSEIYNNDSEYNSTDNDSENDNISCNNTLENDLHNNENNIQNSSNNINFKDYTSYDDYEGQEFQFEETPIIENNNVIGDIVNVNNNNNTSSDYHEFIKETAKKIGYNYQDNKEVGYLTDGDIRFIDDVTDDMIYYRDYDFDNRRIVDEDGYWERIFRRKISMHIEKYGKYVDKKIEFEKNMKVLIDDLNELNSSTSGLRLLGETYNTRDLLKINIAWMIIILSDFVKKSKVGNVSGTSYLNKMWLKLNDNIENLMIRWDEEYEEDLQF